MDSAETLLRHRIEQGDSTQGDALMIAGINVNTGAGLGVVLTAEQFDIPPVNATIGGTRPSSIIPLMPVGLLVAGMISATLTVIDPSVNVADAPMAPIEISVVQVSAHDLKQAYEHLRQQMISEGIPFLNAAELEREIAERKGTRS